MKLDEYLRRSGTKEEAFAAELGTTQASVNRYRSGRRKPRPAMACRIVKATDGAVTLEDLYSEPGDAPATEAAPC